MSACVRGCLGINCFSRRYNKHIFSKNPRLKFLTGAFIPSCKASTQRSQVLGSEEQVAECFEEMLERRRREAGRSILVQVNSELSCPDLHAHCIQYGTVKGLHHYTTSDPVKQHFVVVEFSQADDVQQVMLASGHVDTNQIIPVQSPFLWFRTKERTRRKGALGSAAAIPLVLTNGNAPLAPAKLREAILGASSVCDQMSVLYQATCLDDLGSRLRFLTAHQLELALSGPFPLVRAVPFGSSISSFGKLGCDLDLVLLLGLQEDTDVAPKCLPDHLRMMVFFFADTTTSEMVEECFDARQLWLGKLPHRRDIIIREHSLLSQQLKLPGIGENRCGRLELTGWQNSGSRLVFHTKKALASGRTQVQRHMEVIGDLCHLFLPGCTQVKRILQARIPIVKYRQEFTAIDCDLSISNMSAVYMGELLYVLGCADKRIRPLVFAVRLWAQEVGLTNSTPGPWITNFSLILMVLFFFQHQGVLPSLKNLISRAGPKDKRVTADGVNCTFVRDISKVAAFTSTTSNTDTLEGLLKNFFDYYSSFDYQTRAISVVEGMSVSKPEHSALYIVNPLEPYLNVSKNVSAAETERLRIELRNAAWLLETGACQPRHDGKPWGLSALFEAAKISARGKNIFFTSAASRSAHRLVDVSELFQTEHASDQDISDTSEQATVQVEQSSAVLSSDVGINVHKQDSVSDSTQTSEESMKSKR